MCCTADHSQAIIDLLRRRATSYTLQLFQRQTVMTQSDSEPPTHSAADNCASLSTHPAKRPPIIHRSTRAASPIRVIPYLCPHEPRTSRRANCGASHGIRRALTFVVADTIIRSFDQQTSKCSAKNRSSRRRARQPHSAVRTERTPAHSEEDTI
jgi:hypothetical protein